MDVKITHSNQLSSQTITMFQKIRQLIKKHSIRKFVSFAMWWPINTEETYPFRVDGKGQLCCIETGVLTRKRSSVRDVLLGGVLHSEGNASTPGGGTPIGGLKGEKRNVDQICSFGMFVGGGGNCGTGTGLLSQKKCLSSC